MKLIINVTKNDIDNGLPRNRYCCPIALAVCRTLNLKTETNDVEVDGDIWIKFYNIEHEDIENWIINFDEEKLVFPFSFEMKLEAMEY